MTIATDGRAILGLWTEGQKNFGSGILDDAAELSELALLKETKRWIYDYFAGKRPSPDAIPIRPDGNAFKQAVWTALREIPYGEVATYNKIADRVATLLGKDKMAAPAVKAAIENNPISILIPSHRAVGTGTSIAGGAKADKTQAMLLRLEGVKKTFLAPKKNESETERILTMYGTKLDFSI